MATFSCLANGGFKAVFKIWLLLSGFFFKNGQLSIETSIEDSKLFLVVEIQLGKGKSWNLTFSASQNFDNFRNKIRGFGVKCPFTNKSCWVWFWWKNSIMPFCMKMRLMNDKNQQCFFRLSDYRDEAKRCTSQKLTIVAFGKYVFVFFWDPKNQVTIFSYRIKFQVFALFSPTIHFVMVIVITIVSYVFWKKNRFLRIFLTQFLTLMSDSRFFGAAQKVRI